MLEPTPQKKNPDFGLEEFQDPADPRGGDFPLAASERADLVRPDDEPTKSLDSSVNLSGASSLPGSPPLASIPATHRATDHAMWPKTGRDDIRRTLSVIDAPQPSAQPASWWSSAASDVRPINAAPNAYSPNQENSVMSPIHAMALEVRNLETAIPSDSGLGSGSRPVSGEVDVPAEEATTRPVPGLLYELLERHVMTEEAVAPLEKIIRDTVRSFVATWIDAHLPIMVEQEVNLEMERVAKRVIDRRP